ncbi:hypothetical protein DVH24_007656 [Malus domestica]|uniref:Uncharacterized protein n=1 Tax=Malus domestica TaxID=3750 RepID=A0A498HI47_MALDO|nr:hypothetical protein DVH24_007656 [Malus domestica]
MESHATTYSLFGSHVLDDIAKEKEKQRLKYITTPSFFTYIFRSSPFQYHLYWLYFFYVFSILSLQQCIH